MLRMPSENVYPGRSIMKVYAVAGSQEDIKELIEVCRKKRWEINVVAGRIGRPKSNYSVENVLNAYRRLGKIRATARELKMNPGTVFRILKEHGALRS